MLKPGILTEIDDGTVPPAICPYVELTILVPRIGCLSNYFSIPKSLEEVCSIVKVDVTVPSCNLVPRHQN